MKNLWAVLVIGFAAVCRAEYAGEVMADSPAAYYRFETTNVVDSSGNGHDSLTVSNVTLSEGAVGQAGTFSSNSLVELDLQLNPDAGDFSIEALVRFDVTDVNRTIVRQTNGRDLFYRTPGGNLRTYLGGDGTTSSFPATQDEWHHIVITVEDGPGGSNDVIRFYIDGQAAGGGTQTAESDTGSWILGNNSLIGALDEVAIYDSLLSEDRIKIHNESMPVHADVSSIHYVSTAGDSIWPYTNWTTAARSIQAGVNAAQVGDRVLVSNGVYTSSTEITVEKAISVESVSGPGLVIVDGQGSHRCLNISGGAVIDGFTITNGYVIGVTGSGGSDDSGGIGGVGGAAYGGGLLCGEGAEVRNCVISGNKAVGGRGGNGSDGAGGSGGSAQGGGVCCSGRTALINCSLKGNRAVGGRGGNGDIDRGSGEDGGPGGSAFGGGVCLNETCTVIGCALSANQVVGGQGGSGESATIGGDGGAGGNGYGGDVYGLGGLLQNCTLTDGSSLAGDGGTAGAGETTDYDGSPGSAGRGYGGGAYAGDDAVFLNTIIYSNVATSAGDDWHMDGTDTIFANCCSPGLSGNGNIDVSPEFLDAASGDYHLQSSSPCVDAGKTLVNVVCDVDGTPRPLDGDDDGSAIHDIGAYEYMCVDADSDGDGRLDGHEVANGLDPVRDEASSLAYGETIGVSNVVANPSAYGLYTADSISDLSMGNVMIQTTNGWVRLNLQIEQCTNLADGTWTNAGDTIQWQLEAPDGKAFYRVRSSE